MTSLTKATGGFIAALLITAATASAESVSASMTVSAVVVSRAVIQRATSRIEVEITAADVKRGDVQVSSPIFVAVRTNSRAGYLLQATVSGDWVSALELESGGLKVSVDQSGAFLRRSAVDGRDSIDFGGRVRLAAGTVPGSYALDVNFVAEPL